MLEAYTDQSQGAARILQVRPQYYLGILLVQYMHSIMNARAVGRSVQADPEML